MGDRIQRPIIVTVLRLTVECSIPIRVSVQVSSSSGGITEEWVEDRESCVRLFSGHEMAAVLMRSRELSSQARPPNAPAASSSQTQWVTENKKTRKWVAYMLGVSEGVRGKGRGECDQGIHKRKIF